VWSAPTEERQMTTAQKKDLSHITLTISISTAVKPLGGFQQTWISVRVSQANNINSICHLRNSSKNASCRQLFKDLNILLIQSQYIYSVLLFVTKTKDQFLSNSQVHKINTRQTSDLYEPTANLTIYQKGVYYSGIKIYNHLPTAIKELSGDKNKFKLALKRCLSHSL
jgi:hypothetical protein